MFNHFASNDSDHLHDHGFLRDPRLPGWRLSPLYDVLPRPCLATERYPHLGVGPQGRLATLENALAGHAMLSLSMARACALIDEVWQVVRRWKVPFERSGVSDGDIARIAPAFRHLDDISTAATRKLLPCGVLRARRERFAAARMPARLRGQPHRGDNRQGGTCMHRPWIGLFGGAPLLSAAALLCFTPAMLRAQVVTAPAPAPSGALMGQGPDIAGIAGIAEVETAVRAWAAAWSARDVPRYLAAYASDFTPPRGQDRALWEAERRARITDKAAISVGIDSLVISIRGTSANVTFQQTYSADRLREKSRKTLELQRVGNRWLIRRESAGG